MLLNRHYLSSVDSARHGVKKFIKRYPEAASGVLSNQSGKLPILDNYRQNPTLIEHQ